jgi:hypothetical protein
MNFELYEVWAVDESGHEELVETTSSRKEAMEIAEANLELGYLETIVYKEDENGDLVQVQRFENN